MKCAGLLLVAAFCFDASFAKINSEKGVLVITKDNFETALKEHNKILFKFYVRSCPHCQALHPEFVKAAAKLVELKSNVKLAKIDCSEERELCKAHEIRTVPTLKLSRDGTMIAYTGKSRQAEDIVNWLVENSGPEATKSHKLAKLSA